MNSALIRAGLRQRRRSLWTVWQRSLLSLFLLPPCLVGAVFVLGRLSDLLFQFVVAGDPAVRLATWTGLLAYGWWTALAIVAAMRLMAVGTGELPWVLEVMPASRLSKRLSWNVLPLCGYAALAGIMTVLAARLLRGGLGIYGFEWTLSVVVLFVHFSGALAWGVLLAELARLGWSQLRTQPLASARSSAVVLVLAGLAAAGRLLAGFAFEFPATGVERFFGALFFDRPGVFSGSAITCFVAAVAGSGLLWTACLAPVDNLRATVSERHCSRTWRLPASPWRIVHATDLRLMRRERGGLLSAVFSQLVVLSTVWICLAVPALQASDPAIRSSVLANIVLMLPFVWGSQATLAGGLDALGGQQLLTTPTPLFERLWGKLSASFVLSAINWVACVVAFTLLFAHAGATSVAGLGVGYLVVGVSAAFFAGYVAPPDLASFRALQGSNSTWLLVSVLATGAWAVTWGSGRLFEGRIAGQAAQLACSAGVGAFFIFSCYRFQLSHGRRGL